jgi:long-chain fatty acid transport protein
MKTIISQVMPWAVAAALGGAAATAGASGFQIYPQNASGMGNAYAGQAAAAENASTIFYNPAGMTLLPGRQASLTLNVLQTSVKFSDNGGSRSPAGQPLGPGGDNGGDAGGWHYIPAGYVSWQLTSNLWAGLGVTAPFGLTTDYEQSFIGRYQSQKAQLKSMDINPSLAWKVNDMFSLGAGLSWQKADLTLDRSFFAGPVSPPQHIGLDDTSWGWNVGAMINFSPATRLGLAYRSGVSYDLTGTASVAGIAIAGAAANVKFPANATAGLFHQLNREWQLLADFTWTQWSSIGSVPLVLTTASALGPAGRVPDVLDFEFNNSYRMGVGANYQMNPNLMLKFGAAYDKTPVPDAAHRTVFLPDSDRIWLALGLKYKVSKDFTIDAGYAHEFVSDGDTYRNKGVGAAGVQGIVSGSYSNYVNLFSIQGTISF